MKRRTFSKLSLTAGAFTALGAKQVLGANDRLGVAVIGCGVRGSGHINEISACKDQNAEIRAVCDTHEATLERAYASVVQKDPESKPDKIIDYHEILKRDDIDAVTIATPDFSHARIMIEALKAGKDVYCEKPMAITLKEANQSLETVRKLNRVVQIGTQWRSDGGYIACANVLQSGVLGVITRVQISQNFNHPRWRKNYSGIDKEDVAWDLFQLHAPKHPFDPKLFKRWYLYHDYTNGLPGLWMSHYLNLVAWYMEDLYPAAVVGSGNVYRWGDDGRETSDTLGAILNYPKGWQLNFSMSLCNSADTHCIFYGSNGKLDVLNRTLSGDGGAGPDQIKETKKIEPVASTGHMCNFLECVRSRNDPRCPIEMGHSHSIAGILVAESIRQGRRLGFDPEKKRIYQV